MIRTPISLSKREYTVAKQEATRLGVSLAELLRRSLRSMVVLNRSKPWMKYAGMIESGDSKASRKIDEIVYGTRTKAAYTKPN